MSMEQPAAITRIPDDVLADVFRRASPRGLAACRCVCRAWRAHIDDRRLLRADLLPLSLAGLLLCPNVESDRPELFARPGVDVAGHGHLLPRRTYAIQGHCNGLLLVLDDVVNPATGRVTRLPTRPPSHPLWQRHPRFGEDWHLAFDPAESPHYHVFCIPMVRAPRPGVDNSAIAGSSEWPPSPFVLGVFSSATGRWEARPLVRRGGAAGTVDDMQVPPAGQVLHSACWRGALYVHCQNDFVLRIPFSDDGGGHTTTTTTHYYQVIKPPREVEECEQHHGGRLGRSEKGVYFASFDLEYHLCVWILHHDDECGGHTEWTLTHRSAYGLALPASSSPRSSSWTFHNAFRSQDGDADAQEWDSDDDDDDGESTTLHTETGDGIRERQRLIDFGILAFHTYREIVFMEGTGAKGAAYHSKRSKLEDQALPKRRQTYAWLKYHGKRFPVHALSDGSAVRNLNNIFLTLYIRFAL